MDPKRMIEPCGKVSADGSVISDMADRAAVESNMAAIDKLVKTHKYHHIVAWGKWLGFTPATVQKYVEQAELDNAPVDAIQKIDGKWFCLGDVVNEANRQRIEALLIE